MNQYLKILFFGLLVFGGCEDEPDDFEVSKVPSTFTKKVLIEEFNGFRQKSAKISEISEINVKQFNGISQKRDFC